MMMTEEQVVEESGVGVIEGCSLDAVSDESGGVIKSQEQSGGEGQGGKRSQGEVEESCCAEN